MMKHFIKILYIFFLTRNATFGTNVSKKEETIKGPPSYGKNSVVKVVEELNGNSIEKETTLKNKVRLPFPSDSSNEYLADAGKQSLVIALNTTDSVDPELKQIQQSTEEIMQKMQKICIKYNNIFLQFINLGE
jgi:translation elongation factor P/translation initiation factor 5A